MNFGPGVSPPRPKSEKSILHWPVVSQVQQTGRAVARAVWQTGRRWWWRRSACGDYASPHNWHTCLNSILRLTSRLPVRVHRSCSILFVVYFSCKKGELFDYLTQVVTLSEKRTRSANNFNSALSCSKVIFEDLGLSSICARTDLSNKIRQYELCMMFLLHVFSVFIMPQQNINKQLWGSIQSAGLKMPIHTHFFPGGGFWSVKEVRPTRFLVCHQSSL